MLGEHWKVITEGKGIYYNCNAHKSNYRQCGIGMINYHDNTLREGLEKAALYLTKTDYYIQMLMADKGRSFGKSSLPKSSAKAGKPRKKHLKSLQKVESVIPV
jgi:hypothetical protein